LIQPRLCGEFARICYIQRRRYDVNPLFNVLLLRFVRIQAHLCVALVIAGHCFLTVCVHWGHIRTQRCWSCLLLLKPSCVRPLNLDRIHIPYTIRCACFLWYAVSTMHGKCIFVNDSVSRVSFFVRQPEVLVSGDFPPSVLDSVFSFPFDLDVIVKAIQLAHHLHQSTQSRVVPLVLATQVLC